MPRQSQSAKDSTALFRKFVTAEIEKNHLHQCTGPQAHVYQAIILQQAPLGGEYLVQNDWHGFVRRGLSLFQGNKEIYDLFSTFNNHVRLEKNDGYANHWQKRSAVDALGLRNKARQTSVAGIINAASSFDKAAEQVKQIFGADLVLRERKYAEKDAHLHPGKNTHKYKQYHPLVEIMLPNTPENAILCSASEGFYVVSPHQSVIFVSRDGNKEYNVELVIIRGVPKDRHYTPKLFKWLREVIITACGSRRDVRPSHGGKMTQIGLNMGPRHARVLGWAKSFTRNLTRDEMVAQDEDLIGGMSLLWALVKAYLPQDITGPVQALLDADYPTIATHNVPEGCGFSIELDGKVYKFSEAGRAPPEGIATGGYEAHSHTDPCCVKWAFGWTVACDIPANNPLPLNKGSSYVDLGLKVVVESAPGTLSALQPEQLHGTTFTGGIVNYGLSMTSTRRVYDALWELQLEGVSIRCGYDTDRHDREIGKND